MKNLKLHLSLLLLLSFSSLMGQQSQDILGEWVSKDSDGNGKYSLFEHEGKVYGLMYYWKDDKEEFSLEEELKKYAGEDWKDKEKSSDQEILESLKEFIILMDFVPKGKKWTGKIVTDEKGNTVKGTLKLLSKNELEVGYSSWGFSEKSVWKRVN